MEIDHVLIRVADLDAASHALDAEHSLSTVGSYHFLPEKRTFHSFRHIFAKRALESGAQITWLSRHLSHSSLKVW
jgi:integrase